MCGRYSFTTPADEFAEAFGVADPPPLTPRYNAAPSQHVAVVGLKPDGRTRGVALLRWGLVPRWAASPNSGPRPINVRAESAAAKFGPLLRSRRCLVPADGFYEWTGEGRSKRPYRFTLKSGGPFAFAGLWDAWGKGDDKLATCAVVTTAANGVVGPYHDRMPVIVPPAAYGAWLDPGTPLADVAALLRPYPAEEMRAAEASPAVNSPRNDGPECLSA